MTKFSNFIQFSIRFGQFSKIFQCLQGTLPAAVPPFFAAVARPDPSHRPPLPMSTLGRYRRYRRYRAAGTAGPWPRRCLNGWVIPPMVKICGNGNGMVGSVFAVLTCVDDGIWCWWVIYWMTYWWFLARLLIMFILFLAKRCAKKMNSVEELKIDHL